MDSYALQNEPPKIPTRDLKGKKISPEILKYIPQESAEYYQLAPIGIKDNALEVGIVDPDNTEARNAISFIADKLGISRASLHKKLSEYGIDAGAERKQSVNL